MDNWLLIFAMAAVTYLPRYLPFALAGKVQVPRRLEQALEFVPIAVLTAIIVQTAVFREGQAVLNATNHHALAAIVAFIVALSGRPMFTTIAAGLACFFLLRLSV